MLNKNVPCVVIAALVVSLLAMALFYNNSTRAHIGAVSLVEVPRGEVRLFLDVDGVEGDSVFVGHVGEIELVSFSWGENQSLVSLAPEAASDGGLVGRRDFTFVSCLGRASPRLFLACATGEEVELVRLFVVADSGVGGFSCVTWTFAGVVVTSYDVAAASGDAAPLETFSIKFGRIGVECRQVEADGGLGGVVKAGWDLELNEPWLPP